MKLTAPSLMKQPAFGQVYILPTGRLDLNGDLLQGITGDPSFTSHDEGNIALGVQQMGVMPPEVLPDLYPEGPYDVLITNTNHPSLDEFCRPREDWGGESLEDLESQSHTVFDDADNPFWDRWAEYIRSQFQQGAVTVIDPKHFTSSARPAKPKPTAAASADMVRHDLTIGGMLSQLSEQLTASQLGEFAQRVAQATITEMGELLSEPARNALLPILEKHVKTEMDAFKEPVDDGAKPAGS